MSEILRCTQNDINHTMFQRQRVSRDLLRWQIAAQFYCQCDVTLTYGK